MNKKFAYLVIFALIPSIVSCSVNEAPPLIDNPHLTKVEVNYEFLKQMFAKRFSRTYIWNTKKLKMKKQLMKY